MKYFNEWKNVNDLHKDFLNYGEFDEGKRLEGFPTDKEILFASYEYGGCEGDSLVVFERDGKLYFNSGSHCSCYGLEGQWQPEEVIPEQLAKMTPPYEGHEDGAIEAWKILIGKLVR
jgi:hypothetical protein